MYGDLVGDWREEVITADATRVKDIKVFTTWYPTEHKFPWLMTDHTYLMSALNENAGYNQPTNLGYYLGSDLSSDREAWTNGGYVTGVEQVREQIELKNVADGTCYTLQGVRISAPTACGIYILNGKKTVKW